MGLTQPTEKTVLLARTEAVRLLGVERTTIWRMCRRGDLELVHVGRRALVTRTDREEKEEGPGRD